MDYLVGEDEGDAYARASFSVENEQRISTSFAGNADVDLEAIERAIVNMQALLSDPQVQALRRGEALGLDTQAQR